MDEIKSLIVRHMTREECSLAIEWAAQEGWNPGIHDAECFYAADPNGFFIAELNGKPVGCLSAVAYDEHFGFAGFYIVKPGLRSQGIGHHLIQKATAYMGNRTVGNDAVIAQQETYEKYGFRLNYRNVRYRGIASSLVTNSPEIIDLRKIPFDQLIVYDRGMFPSERSTFLNYWIKQPEGAALGNVKNGQLSGYGVIRKCRQGFKIGPLFADNEEIADNLFLALTAKVHGEEYFLDIPEPNPGARALVIRYDMQMVFETARMYSGIPPSLPLEKIFGVTSFELG
ncbi:MAG: GNAT family N-acetyltransferase [Syntrophus sp. (in: bacteria)]